MAYSRYLTYSVLELAGVIFRVAFRGARRIVMGGYTVVEREWVLQTFSFGVTTMLSAILASLLSGLIAAYFILSQFSNPTAISTFVLPRMGNIFVKAVIPFAISSLLIMKGNIAMTCDIASMRVTQEIEALESVGLHPAELVFAPRALAFIVAAPVFAGLGIYAALAGGWLASLFVWKPDFSEFLVSFAQSISMSMMFTLLVQMVVIAFVTALIGGHYGFNVRETGQQLIGRAVTSATIVSTIAAVAITIFFGLLNNPFDIE